MNRFALLILVSLALVASHASAAGFIDGTDSSVYRSVGYYPGPPAHTDAPALAASLSQQIPYPAQPGEEVTLLIKTRNYGDEPAEDVIWYLDVQEPFELKETEEATQTLPELRCGETANTEYYLTVDPDARSGEYILDLNITYSGDFDSNRHYLTTKSMTELTIRVMGHPDLVLIDADIPEADLKSEFVANFSIKNVGTGPAKNVKVYFKNQTNILPKMSIYYIDTISPGATALIESGFFVDTTTPSQHPLPIAIHYENETHGTQPAQEYSVLVPVSSGNTLFVYLDSQYELTAGVIGEITIGVANCGLARVKHVALAIADGDRFKLIDSDTRYIGDIENDDYDTVDFRILPESSDCSNVTVDVSYDDDYGNTYSMTTEIPIKVYTSEEMKAIAPKSGGYTGIIISALVLLLAYLFRKRIKRIISK
ncbi:MAG: NEW3 domain-containing protein [Euryarchaeota archaeon]|nr:NEW3 domain-containing protein [Euryarchaeota archaeon]